MKNIIIVSVLFLGFFNNYSQKIIKENVKNSYYLTSDDILFRFYYLHRIETSIKYLTKINY